jgi:hypothetical protein
MVVVIDVVVDAVMMASKLSNLTELSAITGLKLEPVIIIVLPCEADVGVNDVIVGGLIVKSAELVAERLFTPTTILPVRVPCPTVTTNCVADADVTDAATPLIFTLLLAAFILKLVPVIVIEVDTVPDVGVNEVIFGGEGGTTIRKSVDEMAVCPLAVTVIFPDVVPAGTAATICVSVADEIVA